MEIVDVKIILDEILGMLDQSEFIQTDVANAIESLYDKFDIQKYTLDASNNYHRSRKLYDIIMSHINSLSSARKELADISTPITLVEEMPNKLPEDIWHNPFFKWFDPAVGKGAFVIVIFERLMKGLQEKIPNEEKRMKHILRNMIYFSDINGLDVQITKHILDPLNKVYGNDDEKSSYWHDKKLKIISVDNTGNATTLQMNKTLHKNELTIDNKELVTQFAKLKLKPDYKRKKQRGEVFTPDSLINEMLDKLPFEVWANPDLKWFDPAVGIGNFMIVIYYHLMDGLRKAFPNENERKTHILQKMLFMSEIDTDNANDCKQIFGVQCKNIYEGDTLTMDISKTFGVDKFDVIVGNPPYNAPQEAKGKRGGGNDLWSKFVKKSIYWNDSEWLRDDGYLVFVHPASWRKPDSKNSKNKNMFKLMTRDNSMFYLEIHDSNDGMNTESK
jgi:hypothetical protein